SAEDRRILELAAEKELLPVINKTDAPQDGAEDEIRRLIASFTEKKPVRISAGTGEGIDLLLQSIYNIFISDSLSRESVVMTNLRHTQCLKEARESLRKAIDSIRRGLAIDFVSIDLRGALLSLGRITGSGAADDLLDTIFSGFCIGK
ncbi:MAG: tRNA uridine-5-carboxymethylaminomethyl(34) synthesis GTPase MnmE, partial [Abditibacteriota bacterium]|nr:tRNA uridine-5-carboxymethylaminomethyl(34) synthesis GTPase MnmE [Abditibacteriota bacterium]